MQTRHNPDGFIYIVRRPSDGRYMGRGSRWIEDPIRARTFGNVGHAKLAINESLRPLHMQPARSGTFEIVPCEVHPKIKLATSYMVTVPT